MTALVLAIAAGAFALLILARAMRRHERAHPVCHFPQPSHVRVIPVARREDRELLRGAA